MTRIQKLNFHPLPGLFSKHLQTILPSYRSSGPEPESMRWIVELDGGDYLSCEVSTPENWKPTDPTIILVHGLGASHSAGYMVRNARKALEKGYKVIRVNLRGCGSGRGLSKIPYHAGCSTDVFRVLECFKREAPLSKVTLIGFSLGANVVLKLAGELGDMASSWFERCFAICTPIDLKQTIFSLGEKKNYIYELYYLRSLATQTDAWTAQNVSSLNELDEVMTAPMNGFKNAEEYYQKCSSMAFLDKIRCPVHILFAKDDPFIDFGILNEASVSDAVNIFTTEYGGHMGYLGRNAKNHDYFWLDQLLEHWIDDDYTSDIAT